jgi:hypothetical protein
MKEHRLPRDLRFYKRFRVLLDRLSKQRRDTRLLAVVMPINLLSLQVAKLKNNNSRKLPKSKTILRLKVVPRLPPLISVSLKREKRRQPLSSAGGRRSSLSRKRPLVLRSGV